MCLFFIFIFFLMLKGKASTSALVTIVVVVFLTGMFFITSGIGVIVTASSSKPSSPQKPSSSSSSVFVQAVVQPIVQPISISQEKVITLPEQQTKFIHVIHSSMQPYDQAPNELKKSVLRTQRKDQIKAALNGNLEVKNWYGIIKTMETTSNGKAHISIILPQSEIQIQNWNNELSDIGDNTLISQNSSLYNSIMDLNEGVPVLFSGRFLRGKDFMKEASLTEEGAMAEPEFLIRFSEVSRAE